TGEAINCYLKVFEGLDKSKDKLSNKLYIETTLKYSKIADIRFNYKKSSYILKNALKRSQKAENLETTAILLMQSAKNEWYGSNYEKAMECFWEGWEISKTIDNPEHRKSALTFSTFFHYWQGLFKKAADIYEQDISADYKFSEGNFSLMAATTVGYCLTMSGQIKQGAGMIDAVCS
ncbi:MAG: hypothetical protein GY730_04020, partial [bacterium]|nr:hypothetical protein [bacterium]